MEDPPGKKNRDVLRCLLCDALVLIDKTKFPTWRDYEEHLITDHKVTTNYSILVKVHMSDLAKCSLYFYKKFI